MKGVNFYDFGFGEFVPGRVPGCCISHYWRATIARHNIKHVLWRAIAHV